MLFYVTLVCHTHPWSLLENGGWKENPCFSALSLTTTPLEISMKKSNLWFKKMRKFQKKMRKILWFLKKPFEKRFFFNFFWKKTKKWETHKKNAQIEGAEKTGSFFLTRWLFSMVNTYLKQRFKKCRRYHNQAQFMLVANSFKHCLVSTLTQKENLPDKNTVLHYLHYLLCYTFLFFFSALTLTFVLPNGPSP